jgi:hypothetical protein
LRFIRDDRVCRQQGANGLTRLGGVELAFRQGRTLGPLEPGSGVGRANGLDEIPQRRHRIFMRLHQGVGRAVVWHQIALLARIREERHGRLGIHQNQMVVAAELYGGQLGEIRNTLDGRQPLASLKPCRKDLAEELGARPFGDLRRRA